MKEMHLVRKCKLKKYSVAKNTKAGLMKPLFMIALVFGPALFLILISLNKCDHQFTELPVYGNMGEYEFITSSGEKVNHITQKDKITIFTTIQASCPQKCAIDLAKFNLLIYQHYRKYQKRLSHIKFVSIATDQDGNPTDQLDDIVYLLEDIIEDYDPKIWKIVTGDPKQIYDIESNEVNLYEQSSDSAFAKKSYLETMMIVDKNNDLRLVRRGNQEGLIRDFKEHIALLQKQYDKAAYKEKNEAKEEN